MAVTAPPSDPGRAPPAEQPLPADELEALIREARRRARRRKAGYALALGALALIAVGLHLTGEHHSRANRAGREPVRGFVAPRCQPSDIRLRPEGIGAGTFHYLTAYAMINTGTNTCRLSGYPRVVTAIYPFRIPLRIHEDNEQIGTLSHWGRPVKTLILRPGARAAFIIAWTGNPDASAARLRYCERRPTRLKVILPHTIQPLPGTHITVYVCPTKYVGWDIEVSPILAAPQPAHES